MKIPLKLLVRFHANDEFVFRHGSGGKNPHATLAAILYRHRQLQSSLKNLVALPGLNQQKLVTIHSRHPRLHLETINIHPGPTVAGAYPTKKSQLLFQLCILILQRFQCMLCILLCRTVNPAVAFEAPAEDPVVAAGEGSDEARRTGIYNLTGLPLFAMPLSFYPLWQ